MRCVVPGCDNTNVSARFHAFPLNNAALCRTWLRSVQHPVFGAETEIKVLRQQQLKVCSDHFVATDYEGVYLKDSAVPIVFPWTGLRQGMLSQSLKVMSNKEDSPVASCSLIKEKAVHQDVKITQEDKGSSILKSKVLVNPQCLLELFMCCSVCLVECCVSIEGSERLFSVIQDCQSCGHHREWKSHPNTPDEPAEDFSKEHKDHKEPFQDKHIKKEKDLQEEHENEDTTVYTTVEHTPEPEDEDSTATPNKEESPVATCSQIKEEPVHQDVKITQTDEGSSILKSKVLVNPQCLLELFTCCSVCLVECCVSIEGSERLFSVIQDCQSCGHRREWKSHPNTPDEPAEDFSEEHKDHKEPFHEKHIKQEKDLQEEHGNEDTAVYTKVEHTPEPEDEDSMQVVLVPHHMKNQVLSMEIKQTILSLRNKKKSIREIGQTLGLSKSTVWNILKKKASTGDVLNKKSSGRPKKTTEEDDQIILSIMMKNPRNPIQQIRDIFREAGREVSANTIRKKLHSLNHLIATASLHNFKMAKQSSTATAGK